MTPPNDRETSSVSEAEADDVTSRKPILVYAPLTVAVALILLPHPSFVIMSSSHYLKTLRSPVAFWVHLLAVHFLTVIVFSSLMACVIRDPGRVTPMSSSNARSRVGVEGDEANIALLTEESESVDVDQMKVTGRWCRRCNVCRPERAHHCSSCRRCVLKMDHHCPWLGGNCVGYRTYPSFLHFLLSSTLLAAYMASVALSVMVHLISNPFSTDPRVTPLHSLFLVLMGAVFALTLGSFLLYHVYLVSVNQTTLEHMSPFLLLRFLPEISGPASRVPPPDHASVEALPSRLPPPKRQPPPPSSPRARPKVSTALAEPPTPPMQSPLTSPLSASSPTHSYLMYPTPPYPTTSSPSSYPSHPLEEHHLSLAQRRLVQHTHGTLRPYDVGLRENWAQVFGSGGHGWTRWVHLILWGGTPRGNGRVFARGPGMQAGLERLARGLDDIRRQEGRGR